VNENEEKTQKKKGKESRKDVKGNNEHRRELG
jgi:hypothetical protein